MDAWSQLELTAGAVEQGTLPRTQFSNDARDIQKLVSRAAKCDSTPATTRSFLRAVADSDTANGREAQVSELVAALAGGERPLRNIGYAGVALNQYFDSSTINPHRISNDGSTPVLMTEVYQAPDAQGPDHPAAVHLNFSWPLNIALALDGTSLGDKLRTESLYFVPKRSDIPELEAMLKTPEQLMGPDAIAAHLRALDASFEAHAAIGIHNDVYHGDYIGDGHADPSVRFSGPLGECTFNPSGLAAIVLAAKNMPA